MYVTKVQLTDIKGFTGARAADLVLPAQGGWTVLAGRNSSGKSTLLRAIALALGGPAVAQTLVADFDDWISVGAESGSVDVRVVPDVSDAFVDKGRAGSKAVSLRMQWDRPEPENGEPASDLLPVLEARGLVDSSDARLGPWADNPRGWFFAGYGPFRRLTGGYSGEAQRLMRAKGPAARVATLFHEDASLAEGVAWLVDLRLRELEEPRGPASVLLRQVLALLQDGLLPDEYQIRGVTADGLWVGEEGSEEGFPLREMSDGYRTVAALVLDIVRRIPTVYGRLRTQWTEGGGLAVVVPGVVLIDEVDAHLHVSWQRKIGGWLRKHFPNIQFIVSSHSPYICQAADPGGLIRLAGPNEQRPPEVVDQELYQRVVYGSGDDAVLSELFGLETPYSSRAEEKRQRLVALERKVYAGTATAEEATEYQRLSELLMSSLDARVTEVAARLGHEQ